MVRTTLDIDERMLEAARALARDEQLSIGAAVSRLIGRGLAAHVTEAKGSEAHEFPTFEVDFNSPPITLDIVNEHRDG